ncbi:MAG: hypothetical protein ACE5JN_04875 [Candidatus Methylomirabilia bacterium]
MVRKRDRVGYGVKPPYIHFGEALDIVRRIHEDAGGSVSEDQLSAIMRNSVGSSSFILKIYALKGFGLVSQEGSGRRIGLSDLARRIVVPTAPEERFRALKEAFLRVEAYRTLFELWAGKILPAEEFFLNTLRERCRIPPELAKRWKESFMSSGAAAGLFQERADRKIQLRMDPNGSTAGRSVAGPATSAQAQGPGEFERFRVPLLRGRIGVVELPKGWTDSDIRKMLEVIRVMFLWERPDMDAGGSHARPKRPRLPKRR